MNLVNLGIAVGAGIISITSVDGSGAVRWVHVGEMNSALVAQALAAAGVP